MRTLLAVALFAGAALPDDASIRWHFPHQFEEARDRSKNLPDDRLYMRCKVAAAAEIMPYANPELDGYAAKGNIGTEHIVRELARSRAIYQRLLPRWEKG